MLRTVLRAIGYALLGLGALGFVFFVGAAVAMAAFGVGLVRTDAFAYVFGIYWIIGPPVALGFALWFAIRR